jgi:hypothetical protein
MARTHTQHKAALVAALALLLPTCQLPCVLGQPRALHTVGRSPHPIYTSAAHEHLAASNLLAGLIAPLTAEFQAHLFNVQHPVECSSARFLVFSGHPVGMGSEIHAAGFHMLSAHAAGRVFMWGEHAGRSFVENGCGKPTNYECFFKPPTSCRPVSMADSGCANANYTGPARNDDPRRVVCHVGHAKPSFEFTNNDTSLLLPPSFYSRLQARGLSDSAIKYWARAQASAYLMRFNDHTLAEVLALRKDSALFNVSSPRAAGIEAGSTPSEPRSAALFPLPPGAVCAHIRGSDKVCAAC